MGFNSCKSVYLFEVWGWIPGSIFSVLSIVIDEIIVTVYINTVSK